MRPRILLVADVEGWAFDNIAGNIARNLHDEYDVTTCYMADMDADPVALLAQRLLPGGLDLVHFFWRDDLRGVLHPAAIHRTAARAGVPVEAVIDALCAPALTASVYDHLHLSAPALAERAGALHFAHGYSTSSPILDALYRDAPGLPAPDAMIPDGVRCDFFRPGPAAPEGVAGPGGPLVVGWVGNSKWGAHSHADAKGLQTVLRPALASLQAEGIAIEAHFADVQDRRRSRDEMAAYYREIDVLVCASSMEGTPNPVLEAMASGAAVVSTDVGIVRAALGPRQAQMILAERSAEAMAAALRRLAGDRALLAALKAENRARAPDWDWSVTTRGWLDLWAQARARHGDPRACLLRRALLDAQCRTLVGAAATGPIPVWQPSWRRRLRARAVDWLYARPRLARTVNQLRGRRT